MGVHKLPGVAWRTVGGDTGVDPLATQLIDQPSRALPPGRVGGGDCKGEPPPPVSTIAGLAGDVVASFVSCLDPCSTLSLSPGGIVTLSVGCPVEVLTTDVAGDGERAAAFPFRVSRPPRNTAKPIAPTTIRPARPPRTRSRVPTNTGSFVLREALFCERTSRLSRMRTHIEGREIRARWPRTS